MVKLELTEELKETFTNLIIYLLDKNKINIKFSEIGLVIINTSNNDLICINNDFVKLKSIKKHIANIKNDKSVFRKLNEIGDIIEFFENILATLLCNNSIEYTNILEELKDKINICAVNLEQLKKSSNNSKTSISIPVPDLAGDRLIDFASADKRVILIRNHPTTDNSKVVYEVPMINNLSKIWNGLKLHRNFSIIEVTKKNTNPKVLCEFDCVGVFDNILCIFEIKNKATIELPHFLEQVNEYSKYIIEWLIKNKINIKYVAPVVYFREETEDNKKDYGFLNPIYYNNIIKEEPQILTKLYEINRITLEIDINTPIIKEAKITKEKETKEQEEIIKEIIEDSPTYIPTSITEEQYYKIAELIDNNIHNLNFKTIDDFVIFAVNNTLNTFELMDKIKNNNDSDNIN